MRKLTILVDMDGTIEDLLSVWVKRLNSQFGRNVKIEDITSWDMSLAYPGLTDDELQGPTYDDSIWEEVQPIKDASLVLEKLKNKGHDIIIVTASPYQSLDSKMRNHLFKYFPFIKWRDVIITSHKELVSGDVLIDDGLHNILNTNAIRVLFDAPYNRDVDDEKNKIHRVYNWLEIEKLIDTF